MKSTFKIIWSEESLDNLDSIVDYLEKNWTNKEIISFFFSVSK